MTLAKRTDDQAGRTTGLRWLALGAVLAVGLIAAAAAVLREVAVRHQAELLADYEAAELVRVESLAKDIERDFSDVRDDLRFVSELMATADSLADRRRELSALLSVVRPYKLLVLHRCSGEALLSVGDQTTVPPAPADPLSGALSEVAVAACSLPEGRVHSSSALPGLPKWWRAFSTRLPGASEPRALVAVIDVEPFFSPLTVAPEPGTQVMVLGGRGNVLHDLEPDSLREGHAAALREAMRKGGRGSRMIPSADGSGPALVAAFAPLVGPDARAWSIAQVRSAAGLRHAEDNLVRRLYLSGAAILSGVLALAAYVTFASYRSASARARLSHLAAIAEHHDELSRILDSLPAIVLVLDADGGIETANLQARRAGFAAGQGASAWSLFATSAPGEAERLQTLIARARREEGVVSAASPPLALPGVGGTFSAHAAALTGGEGRVVLALENVTELGQVTEQLVRAEKLATVGVLAAGIAHEIGTPLGVVQARAERIAEKLGPEHPLLASTKVIQEQTERISHTIRVLLDYSRSHTPVAGGSTSASFALRSLNELLGLELERRRVALETSAPERPLFVKAGKEELEQVLLNLTINALDASRPGETVRVKASESADGDAVDFVVEDQGVGMEEDVRRRAFDPFFTTKAAGKGTGLGLTIVAQIADKHGAAIALDSQPGRGTRVTLSWPAALAAEKSR